MRVDVAESQPGTAVPHGDHRNVGSQGDHVTPAVIQADQLGVSMAKMLRVQSEQLRVRRRQHAEQLAQKAPLKMLFPMILFIFPSVFVVILGPSIPQIMSGFS